MPAGMITKQDEQTPDRQSADVLRMSIVLITFNEQKIIIIWTAHMFLGHIFDLYEQHVPEISARNRTKQQLILSVQPYIQMYTVYIFYIQLEHVRGKYTRKLEE